MIKSTVVYNQTGIIFDKSTDHQSETILYVPTHRRKLCEVFVSIARGPLLITLSRCFRLVFGKRFKIVRREYTLNLNDNSTEGVRLNVSHSFKECNIEVRNMFFKFDLVAWSIIY